MSKKPVASNRSRTPHSKEFLDFISSDWADQPAGTPSRWEVADFAAKRREKLAAQFKGKLLIIEAGETKVRSNDTEYQYRAHTAFSHLTGWGSETVPGSVLVIDARGKKTKHALYFRPTAGRESDEFFANPMIGEFWVGKSSTPLCALRRTRRNSRRLSGRGQSKSARNSIPGEGKARTPCRRRTNGRTNSRKVTKLDTGLPGSPMNGTLCT